MHSLFTWKFKQEALFRLLPLTPPMQKEGAPPEWGAPKGERTNDNGDGDLHSNARGLPNPVGKGAGKPKLGEAGDRKARQLTLEAELHSLALPGTPRLRRGSQVHGQKGR